MRNRYCLPSNPFSSKRIMLLIVTAAISSSALLAGCGTKAEDKTTAPSSATTSQAGAPQAGKPQATGNNPDQIIKEAKEGKDNN